MVNLGNSIGVSSSHLILRARGPFEKTTLPKIGEKVVNLESKVIGKISDVFGPVKKPFISVKVAPNQTLESFKENVSKSYYTQDLRTKRSSGGYKGKGRGTGRVTGTGTGTGRGRGTGKGKTNSRSKNTPYSPKRNINSQRKK